MTCFLALVGTRTKKSLLVCPRRAKQWSGKRRRQKHTSTKEKSVTHGQNKKMPRRRIDSAFLRMVEGSRSPPSRPLQTLHVLTICSAVVHAHRSSLHSRCAIEPRFLAFARVLKKRTATDAPFFLWSLAGDQLALFVSFYNCT